MNGSRRVKARRYAAFVWLVVGGHESDCILKKPLVRPIGRARSVSPEAFDELIFSSGSLREVLKMPTSNLRPRRSSLQTLSRFLLVLGSFGLLLAPSAALAEGGDWLIRFRAINVDPDEESSAVRSDGVDIAGTSVSVEDDTVPELDITYMLSDRVGLELVLGTSQHDIFGAGGLSSLGKIADSRVLPPTLVLQYHLAPNAVFRPYIGIGVNYTLFYDEEPTTSFAAAVGGVQEVELDDSFGWAAQVGFDISLGGRWFLNVDAKRIDIETEATILTSGPLGTVSVDVDLQPTVFGAGFGFSF